VAPSVALRPRGARQSAFALATLLGAVAVVLAGCTTTPSQGAPHSLGVLGQPRGTPRVLGQPAPTGTGTLLAVACASSTHCWAVGTTPETVPPGGADVIVATKDGGRVWKAQHITGGSTPQLSGVSCPTPTDCLAVGSNGASVPGSGVAVATTDGGKTWSPVAAPTALTVMGVTCLTVSNCVALVSDGTLVWSATSANFGQTWQQQGNMPSLFVAGNDLSCTVAGVCLVAGYVPTGTGQGEGAMALSTDGGHTWALASVPNGVGVLRSVVCVTATDCLAAGTTATTVSDVVPAHGELLDSADGGHTWAPATNQPPVDDVFGVACPSAKVCAMVGTEWQGTPAVGTGAVAQSGDSGTTFKMSSSAYVPLTLTALSCPDATLCVAAGGDTLARITVITPTPVPKHTHHP
jgi:photosystem II stability/assembly factor-like uncharacterized protein